MSGSLRFSSILTSEGGPLAGVPVSITITALGPTFRTITLTDIVPEETKRVLVGFRCNEEGAGPAAINLKVYRITYADGGSSKNRVVNSDFGSGFYGWDVWGTGEATVRSSDRGDGRMLRLRASPEENIGINSIPVLRVTPGSSFKLTVKAMVPPAGSMTGYASVFFLWGKDYIEGHRITVPLVAPAIPDVAATTAADGAVDLDLPLPAGRYSVRIAYAGDPEHLAASTELEVRVP